MARLFLLVWLGAFAVQTSDLVMIVAADECAAATDCSADDSCGQDCALCICCARVVTVVTAAPATLAANVSMSTATLYWTDTPADPAPHRILHVPKAL